MAERHPYPAADPLPAARPARRGAVPHDAGASPCGSACSARSSSSRFAVLFFRLWALQVLSGTQYLAAAQNNQLRTIRIEAPRGPILDYKGRLLVANRIGDRRAGLAGVLPATAGADAAPALRRSSASRSPELQQTLREHKGDPLTPVTLKEDAQRGRGPLPEGAPEGVPRRAIERTSTCATTRTGRSRAQILGHVGAVTRRTAQGRPLPPRRHVGQGGRRGCV